MSSGPRRSAYDVVVLGGGIIGLSVGWRAAQAGMGTLVVERGEPGGGASGVAAGMLAPVTEADFGERELLELNLASRALWPAFARELEQATGRSTGFRQSGAIVAAADRDDPGELRRLLELQQSLGLDAEWVPGRELRRIEPRLSPRVSGGILAPEEAHVDPRAAVEALVDAFERAGGEIAHAEATAVQMNDTGDSVVGVESDAGRIPAGQVVVACGAHSELLDLPPGHPGAPRLRPVKGQILRLRGPVALVERIVRTPRCYVVDRGDGRVVLGATVEEQGFDERVTAEGVFRLIEAGREVLPEIGELEFCEALAGLRPGTPDNLPWIGPDQLDGLLWATGHYRNGVLLAPLTAEIVVALMTGEEAPIEAGACAPASRMGADR